MFRDAVIIGACVSSALLFLAEEFTSGAVMFVGVCVLWREDEGIKQ